MTALLLSGGLLIAAICYFGSVLLRVHREYKVWKLSDPGVVADDPGEAEESRGGPLRTNRPGTSPEQVRHRKKEAKVRIEAISTSAVKRGLFAGSGA